ncbi:MAG: Gfo/Idh/MocA family oxidoreductase [Verrucomicrobiales bacterium]
MNPRPRLNVAILGHRFMGRAHSNAWRQVSRFFETPFDPVLKVACGQDTDCLEAFASRWGWEETETDWRRVVERDDIDAIDIALPTFLHAEVAIAAANAGKHIFCEKPFAINLGEAEAMLAAATRAGVVHYLNHNYRRCPAVVLARQLIESGELGTIRHWRGGYQQSWLNDPEHPLDWKLRKKMAGAGPLWDLGSHAIDLAHYLVGDIASLSCHTKNFISERPLDGNPGVRGTVEVECAANLMLEFRTGAVGTIETTRYATGRQNRHTFEVYGQNGALVWDLEDMNRLRFHSESGSPSTRGFRDILVTETTHDYVRNWWPPGHVIGYEHTFVHAVADFLNAIAAGPAAPGITPDFHDGVRITRVMEAALESASTGRRVNLGV